MTGEDTALQYVSENEPRKTEDGLVRNRLSVNQLRGAANLTW